MNIRDRIEALHGQAFLRKSALNIRGGAGVFERVLSGKGYRNVLEIGTYRGAGAAEMAQYCEKVITIDLQFGKLERNGTTFDREAFWRSLGVNNIEFHAVSGDHEKAKLISNLEFDLAFIDGAHTGGAVARDFEMVKRCGKVLIHDYDDNGRGPQFNEAFDFVNSLPKDQVQILDIFALWTAP